MINRVILSTTSHPDYLDGIGYVIQAWRNMGIPVTVICIGDGFNDIQFENISFKDKQPTFVRIQSVEGIPDENLAKVARVLFTMMYESEYCLISDADMLPMNPAYFIDNSKKAKEDSILFYTSELTGEDKGKFPACYMLALGITFKRYMITEGGIMADVIKTWNFGEMADITKLPFSDESLYRELFKDAPKICLERYHQDRRLCRSNWPEGLTVEKIQKANYIDCHMPRPVSQNMDKLRVVFESIGIKA